MLTPSEEVGLMGQRLANRVQHALDSIPPPEMTALLDELQRLATERHLAYQRDGVTETVRLLPCPLTMRPDQLGYTHYISTTILNCIKRLPDLYLTVPRVRSILQLTPIEDEWLGSCWNPSHREANPIYARLDAVVDYSTAIWKDTLKFLEPNLTGIGGLHLGPTADRILADVVVPALLRQDPRIRLQIVTDIRELLLQDLLEHLDAIGRPNGQIVLVDPKYEKEGPDEPDALAHYYAERGYRVLHADPSELSLRGNEVYYFDAKVDLVYRDYSVLDLVDLAEQGVDVSPMRTLFRQNRVVSSIAAELDQKSCWEIFTDNELCERFLSVEEAQIMRRHVLWTRLIGERTTTSPNGQRIDLLEYIHHERETLVIKPNRSYGGTDVVVGAITDQPDWDAAIDHALADPGNRFVVQQLAHIPVKSFHVLDDQRNLHCEPYFVVMGFAPSRYGVALLSRASQKYVVNVAQRGGLCALMVGASALHGPFA